MPAHLGELVLCAASFLAEFGQAFEPNDWILSGSYSARAEPVSDDCDLHADFGPLGDVRLRVSAGV